MKSVIFFPIFCQIVSRLMKMDKNDWKLLLTEDEIYHLKFCSVENILRVEHQWKIDGFLIFL